MIQKLLETLFRHKVLILLPPVIMPLLVAPVALLAAPSYYESWAGIWVERPTYLDYSDDSNRFIPPAVAQRGQLQELLRTRSFVMDVASRIPSLAPLVGLDEGEVIIRRVLLNGLTTATSGNHLMVLSARTSSPQLSAQIVAGVAETFRDRATSDRVAQAEIAISFYESRVRTAEDELGRANSALARYVAANPRLAISDTTAVAGSGLGRLPAAATDPQLSELMRRADMERRDVEHLQGSLEQARLNVSASLEGQELGFQLVDPPQVPTTRTRELRKSVIFVAGTGVIGLILGAMLVALLMAADRTARAETDFSPAIRVLGIVPRIQPGGKLADAPGDRARQAIGFVTGALPAPGGGGSA